MTALLVVREKVFRPLLAGARYNGSEPLTGRSTLLDDLYHSLRAELHNLFGLLNINVQAV